MARLDGQQSFTAALRMCNRVQVLIKARTAYAQQVDAEMQTPEQCFVTMIRRCHHCIGKYFCAWRDTCTGALVDHAEVVRDAAMLELHLVEQLKGYGKTIEAFQVRPLHTSGYKPAEFLGRCIARGSRGADDAAAQVLP